MAPIICYSKEAALLARAAGRQVSPGTSAPMRTDVEVVVGHNFAFVGCSRLVVGPCIACSWRFRVAPAPEVLCFAPPSIVSKQGDSLVNLVVLTSWQELRAVRCCRGLRSPM